MHAEHRASKQIPVQRGFIYVLAPPPELGLHNALRFQCHRNSYDGDWHFLRRLLVDPSARSHRMSDASLFYAPVWASDSFGNIASRKYGDAAAQVVKWLMQFHEEHWLANTSRYVLHFTGDLGACHVPRWGQINVAYLGLQVPFEYQTTPGLWRFNASNAGQCVASPSLTCARAPACFERPRDVLMPFYDAYDPRALEIPAELAVLQRQGRWECELFFAGALQHGRFSPMYAQQVRQAVHDHHINRSGFCLHIPMDKGNLAPASMIYKSRFCLAPMGHGFGDRLQMAMRHGCVPLIVQPGVVQPLDDILPYEEFSISIDGFSGIPLLHHTLASISESAHSRLREGVRRWAPAFNWHDEFGLAYEYSRYALCLKGAALARAAETAFDCAPLQPEELIRSRARGSRLRGRVGSRERHAWGALSDIMNASGQQNVSSQV